MTAIRKGSHQLELLLPLISKAIVGAEKYGETTLATILAKWRQEALQFLSAPPLPVQSSQVATANVDTVKPTNIEMGPPIDPELDQITKFYMAEYDQDEEDAAQAAAVALSKGLTFSDIVSRAQTLNSPTSDS